MSAFIHIKKQTLRRGDTPQEVYVVPAVAIVSPQQGKMLVPNPHGMETCVFKTLEDAVEAVRRSGFDYEYEGQKTYTLDTTPSARGHGMYSSGASLEDAIPLLMQRLSDKEPTVLAHAAQALGNLQAKEAVPGLLKLLSHEDATVRKTVAEAFAKLGGVGLHALKPAYKEAQNSREKNAAHARLTVMSAFLEMAHTHPELISQLIPQTLEALNDESWLVRAQAALVIARAAERAETEDG